MKIIPAVDIKGGNVVRLFQGRSKDETLYSKNPLAMARHWQKEGAELLHIVDLDGAFSGKPQNTEVVKKIIKGISIPVQLGGGLRTVAAVRQAFKLGVESVIVGTQAIRDRDFLASLLKEFGEKVLVSVDARKGRVYAEGWQIPQEGPGAVEFSEQLQSAGVQRIVYTEISKDGTMKGPDLKSIRDLLTATGLSITASGGIASTEDIKALRHMSKRITGAIVGKALYENKFTLKEAQKAAG